FFHSSFLGMFYSWNALWSSAVFVCSARGYYFLGYTMCALEAAMGAVAGLVTSWSLAMLSLERYLVICKPFGAFKFGSSHAAGAVVFTWFMGVGCASPPFFGWSRYIPEGLGCACGPDWYTNDQELGTTSYMYFLLITCFCMPLSIIIFSYSQLLGALRAVAAQQAESASTQKAEKEVSRMIIVMVGSFVTCYAPYALTGLWFANSPEVNKDYRLVTIPAFFSKSSCVYNPLIYAFMNKQVRTNAPSTSTSLLPSATPFTNPTSNKSASPGDNLPKYRRSPQTHKRHPHTNNPSSCRSDKHLYYHIDAAGCSHYLIKSYHTHA
uniref:Opsin 1 (cone pigments), short-wave-sensitive 1 n=1 Tax=Fundulus heteroclitus TaxID=8078 RepID=A0A3Q2PEQ6_FUNHE